MTRTEAFKELFSLESKGINIDSMIEEMALSKEVPESVEIFLSTIKNYPIFIEKLQNKQFYKVITRGENLSVVEQAKALSSLITHTLIEFEGIDKNNILGLSNSVYIDEVLDALGGYMLGGDESGIIEVTNKLRDLFNKKF